jgi:hypothetical protein
MVTVGTVILLLLILGAGIAAWKAIQRNVR